MTERSIYERTDDDLVKSGRIKGTIRYDYLFFGLNILEEKNHYESKLPDWIYNKTGTKDLYKDYKIYNLFYGATYSYRFTKN